MLGSLCVTLITKPPSWLYANGFHLVVRKFAKNFIATPRAL
jgi:hypothetical protein